MSINVWKIINKKNIKLILYFSHINYMTEKSRQEKQNNKKNFLCITQQYNVTKQTNK